MHFSATFDVANGPEQLRKAFDKRAEQMAARIAKLGADYARQRAGNKTPGTTYDGDYFKRGPSAYDITVWADPRSVGADINLRIALVGHGPYTIKPKQAKVMAWAPEGDGTGYSTRVNRKAKPPIDGGDFILKAVKRAVQRVKNDYR